MIKDFKFPSPHSGILFLCEYGLNVSYSSLNGFRPLIRGFFFYNVSYSSLNGNAYSFRPLIRGFFFYMREHSYCLNRQKGFPSPHSGILFLYYSGCV